VPVRTFDDWNDPAPGYVEADLVLHCGASPKGSDLQTLTLTDIATGWTECASLMSREQVLLTKVLDEVRGALPFPLLGFDTDNDTVFMNETVKAYCTQAGVEFTRCRPYRKNDQAWVEQKNGAVVRRMVGYRRYVGLEAATVLARLYKSVRLYVNHFQPSFKLANKKREGARSASATILRRRRSRACWRIREPRTTCVGDCRRCTRRSTPWRFCTTSARSRANWSSWPTDPPPMTPPPPPHRRSSSS